MEGQRPTPNSLSAPLGTHNAILRARSRTHVVKDFAGPLSIKSVTAGTVAWKSGRRDLVVDCDSFLVLHDGEPYSMNIDSPTPVGTLCVFFQQGFAESVQSALANGELDAEPTPAPFLGHLHMRDDRILPRMQAIANSPEAGRLWLDEQFLLLARDLLLLEHARSQSACGITGKDRADALQQHWAIVVCVVDIMNRATTDGATTIQNRLVDFQPMHAFTPEAGQQSRVDVEDFPFISRWDFQQAKPARQAD